MHACRSTLEDPTDRPTATSTLTSTASQTATGTVADATPTAGSPSPSPTTDPDAPLGLIEIIAGQTVRVLEKGDPVAFPADMVLYFNATCYACEGGYNLQRAYRDAAGTIVVDPITVLTLPAPGPGSREDTYVHSYSLAPNGHDAFAIVCTGNCGGVGDIQPGSTAELWHSKDGGITWTQVAPIAIDSYVFIAGILERRALIGYFPLGSSGAEPTYVWMPGGDVATPPADFKVPRAHSVPGYGLAWTDESGGSAPYRVRSFNLSGIDIIRPPDTQLQWTLAEVTPDGFFIWSGYPPSSPSVYSYVAFATPDGKVDRVYAWPGYDFRVLDDLDNRVFIGNALTTDDRAMAIQLPHGPLAFEPVIIDFATEKVHVISGLPPAESASVGGYTFPVLALTGVFARIDAGDECLHLRTEPSLTGESIGCFPSGVLLRVRLGFAEPGWTAVAGPGGIEGWASSEFLARAAGGAE